MDLSTLFDASAVVSTLGLIGVLGIIFMETGLLIGLVFPGGEVVFLAGMAASSAGADVLGDAKLSAPADEAAIPAKKTTSPPGKTRPIKRPVSIKMMPRTPINPRVDTTASASKRVDMSIPSA